MFRAPKLALAVALNRMAGGNPPTAPASASSWHGRFRAAKTAWPGRAE
jgi:hypothetical protein